MNDHSSDAPVSPERLDELIEYLDECDLPESIWQNAIVALHELKALRNKEPPHCPTCSCEQGSWGDHTCIWTPLELGRYEACVSIHDVSQCDDGTDALPAFCEDCGGRVVVDQSNG